MEKNEQTIESHLITGLMLKGFEKEPACVLTSILETDSKKLDMIAWRGMNRQAEMHDITLKAVEIAKRE